MQSFMVWIRHIPGAQNKVADWMTRLEKYYEANCLFVLDIEEDDMIQDLLAILICDEDDCKEDACVRLQVNHVDTVELFQSETPAPKVWTPDKMFA